MKCYVTDNDKRFEETEIKTEWGNAGEMNQVRVYPGRQFETFLGMGGALTEAAAYTYSQMGENNQKKLLDLYFGEGSINYNFNRIHIQSCDFSLGNYAYINDKDDKELKTFNLERDHKYIIPFIKETMKRNGNMSFLASPWSPPAFMKSNGDMNHGGKLLPEYREMWADMIAKFITEYEKLGIKVTRLTIQNEPAATQTWDSCIYTAAEEGDFAVNFLKPALKKIGREDIKINVWDHNKELMIDRAEGSFAVEGADRAVDGIAFHWYTGDHFEALSEVRREFPDKELIFTEGCVEYSRYTAQDPIFYAEKYAHEIIGDFLAGANAFMDWNIYLDKQGGPNHVGNYCDAPVMCDTQKDTVDVKLSYYYIGHFSKFIKPGARRILVSRFTSDIETLAFDNPDGETVMIVLNREDRDVTFSIYDGEKHAGITAKAHSIMTLIW